MMLNETVVNVINTYANVLAEKQTALNTVIESLGSFPSALERIEAATLGLSAADNVALPMVRSLIFLGVDDVETLEGDDRSLMEGFMVSIQHFQHTLSHLSEWRHSETTRFVALRDEVGELVSFTVSLENLLAFIANRTTNRTLTTFEEVEQEFNTIAESANGAPTAETVPQVGPRLAALTDVVINICQCMENITTALDTMAESGEDVSRFDENKRVAGALMGSVISGMVDGMGQVIQAGDGLLSQTVLNNYEAARNTLSGLVLNR